MGLYRFLLLAFPADVRRDFGDDMAQMFAAEIQAAGANRVLRGKLWCRAAGDAIVHGLGARFDRTGRTRPMVNSVRRWRVWMTAIGQDLRYATRLFRADRTTALIAIVTLAIGIGANTAIFSAVDAILLRPLPYPNPEQLVMVWEKRPSEGVLDNVVAPADFADWEQMNTTFSSMAAMATTTADLTGTGEPVRLRTGVVSTAFFDVLSVRPMLGRSFVPEEAIVGRHRVVLLSQEAWRDRFASDRAIVGRKLLLNGIPHEVVGVLPESFVFPDESIEVWVPIALRGLTEPLSRASHSFFVYARMKPGITLAAARADMDRVGALLSEQYPDTNRTHGAWVTMLSEEVREPVRGALWLLLGAVAFVLLIACVNVANLLLARMAVRQREFAVRAAVGAGRRRIAGQMLTESMLLGLLGGAAGLLIAHWGIQLVQSLAPENLPVLGLQRISLDARVLAFTFVVSLLTAVLFGTLPAWTLAGQDVNEALKSGGRTGGHVSRRYRVALVVSEIALASLLLVGAGLSWRSFQALLSTDAGLRLEGVLTAFVSLPAARYRSEEKILTTFSEIEQRFASIPGVRSAGAITMLPLSGADGRRGVGIEGRQPDPDAPTRAHIRSVTPGYFGTMGIQVTLGRSFTAADHAGAPPVVIVNETMARRYWPDGSPVGRRLALNDGSGWREVVGVVRDVRHWGLDQPVNPELYFPFPQMPLSVLTFALAVDGKPAPLAPAVREQLRAVDPDLPLSRVQSMEQVATRSVEARGLGMWLLAVFGMLALALAAAGIYAVMSHLVALRSSEIGVRMTLGARPPDIMRLVLREGVLQAVVGLSLGVSAGVLLMRAFRSMLYEISPADPVTLAAVAAALLVTALLACLLPARRATRVDPVVTLRQ